MHGKVTQQVDQMLAEVARVGRTGQYSQVLEVEAVAAVLPRSYVLETESSYADAAVPAQLLDELYTLNRIWRYLASRKRSLCSTFG